MDQLRNVPYKRPPVSYPWDPLRREQSDYFNDRPADVINGGVGDTTPTAHMGLTPGVSDDGAHSDTNSNKMGETPKNVVSPEWQPSIDPDTIQSRGHPAVCKMLDFFEDREFYYRESCSNVLPRLDTRLD